MPLWQEVQNSSVETAMGIHNGQQEGGYLFTAGHTLVPFNVTRDVEHFTFILDSSSLNPTTNMATAMMVVGFWVL